MPYYTKPEVISESGTPVEVCVEIGGVNDDSLGKSV